MIASKTICSWRTTKTSGRKKLTGRPGLSPPRVWRWMEYGPVGGRKVFGSGPLRSTLESMHLVDAGAGATWASLANRGLILQTYRAFLPRMSSLHIRMTPAGRKVARVLRGLPISKPKPSGQKPLSLTALRLLHYGQQHPTAAFDYLQPWSDQFGMPDLLIALGAARGLIKRGLLSGAIDARALRITRSGAVIDVAAEPNWRPFKKPVGGSV